MSRAAVREKAAQLVHKAREERRLARDFHGAQASAMAAAAEQRAWDALTMAVSLLLDLDDMRHEP